MTHKQQMVRKALRMMGHDPDSTTAHINEVRRMTENAYDSGFLLIPGEVNSHIKGYVDTGRSVPDYH